MLVMMKMMVMVMMVMMMMVTIMRIVMMMMWSACSLASQASWLRIVAQAGALRAPCLCGIFAVLFGCGHVASNVSAAGAWEAWDCRA